MFLRFERVQRPQSFNDNPITSLSWMADDNGHLDGSGVAGNGGHHHPGGSSASPSASPSGSGDNNNNHGDQNQPQQQQDNHHHHHHHHPLFDDNDEPSRDINNNDTTNDGHQHHHDHHHHHHHNHDHPHDHDHTQQQHHSHNHHNHQHLSPHPHCCESTIVKQASQSSASSKDHQEWPEILDGWLAVGNCRGVVGVSYTTIDSQQSVDFWDKSDPLIGGDTTSSILDTPGNGTMMMDDNDEHEHYRDHFHDHDLHLHYHHHHSHHVHHQQQQQNRSITMPKSVPVRTNFNLRGHRSEIVFVRWNEPYQKLASCDRNGVIFVWIKYEGRWSIELINDRNTRVTDFAWSHDGRMALICYMDGFVLVGSVSGQRYWSSMLNLNECSITCGTWTPTNQSVLFGTSNGHILVISVHGVFITQISVQEGMEIIGMQWSCRKFMKTNEHQQPQQQRRGEQQGDQSNGSSENTGDTPTQHQQHQQQYMLAVSFVDGTIYLMKNYDEVFPNVIETSLINVKMEWSNDGEILAIGGHRLIRSMNRNPVPGPYMYQNIVRFYRSNGQLIKQVILDFNWQPLSALTWACNDRRMFIACGQLLYVAWIIHGIPSLSFFSGLQVYNGLKKFDDIDRLLVPVPVKNLLGELFTPTIHCYLPDYNDIGRFVFRPPANHRRLHCTLMRHEDLTNSSVDAIYILYLEYLGSLVPILKGKRSSKIKPEFIIFDPRRNCTTNSHDNNGDQMACGHNHHHHHHQQHQQQHKSIHDNNLNMNERKFRCLMANNTNHNNIGWIHPPPPNVPVPPPPPPPQAPLPSATSDSDNDDSEHSGIFMGQPPFLTPKTRRRLRLSSSSSRSHGSRGPRRRRRSSEQPPFQQDGDGGDGDAGGGEQSLPRMSRHYQHHHHLHYTPWLDELPETERIVLVTSNIWGTKFKFLSLTPQLPGHIGSVTYKTSLLHLQPRQMSLVIKELNENNTLNHMPSMMCPSDGHHHCCADHHHHQHHLLEDTLDNLDNKNTNHDPNRSTGLYSYSSYCSSEESEDEEQQQQQLQLQLRQQQQQQMAEMLMMDMPDQMTSMPTIVPIGSLNAVRNSMLLSLTDLNADQQQPQPPPPQDVHNDPQAMVGPSGGGQSQLQSQINQEWMSSYTVEIKPSTSMAPKTTTTVATTTANYNNNNGGGGNNDHNGEQMTPPVSPGSPAPSLKTKRSQISNSTTMVRQFKHQTFHSESPKHVSAFYRQQPHPQQQQPTTSQSQPMSPKNGSPNRQGSRSSPRRNSTVSCCVQKFQKKTGYSIDTAAAAAADGTPTNSVDRQKMLFEIDLDGGSAASTAMVAVGGGGGGGGISHCATPTAYQTFHIYDDTDLRKATKRLNHENNVLNNSDNDDDDDEKEGVDRLKSRPLEMDETENYLKNVEQVVQSLSEKLSQKMNASNNLIRKQEELIQEYSNSSSVSNLSQQQQCFSNGGGRKQPSMLGCDGLQSRNLSLLSINSLANSNNESENRILPNLPPQPTTSGGGSRKHHHHHQQKNPISLPSSPLFNQDRRKLSMDYPSVSGSQMLGASQPRKSNGRHFFQSPKLVRKLRRKWSYLDCSSEDDNSSDDDDDDPGSLSLTDETDASISSINVRKRRMLNALNRKDEMRKLPQHAPCNTPVQHQCLKNAKHHGHKKGKGPRHHHEDDSLDDGKRFTLHNKAPLWNEVSQVYQLDFGGRVTQESAKNFQIEHQGKQVMQFGRIDTNAYTLDFEYPFSAIQAMAVALANVTQRLK